MSEKAKDQKNNKKNQDLLFKEIFPPKNDPPVPNRAHTQMKAENSDCKNKK